MGESYNPGRIGVLHTNPRGTSWIDEFIKTSEGLGRMGEQRQKNRMMDLENQGLPAKQQAALDFNKAQIAEAAARSGLYGAQGQEALGRIPLMNAQAAEAYGRIPLMGAQGRELNARAGLLGAQNTMLGQNMALAKEMGKAGFVADGLGGWVKDPRMGSYRSGAGGTYVDPQTGQMVSTDTTNQASRDQRAIAGTKNVTEYLNEAMKTMPQFLTAKEKLKLNAQRVGNLMGADYQGPSQFASGQAAILESAEGFINTFGLNSTGENVARAAKIMEPAVGESGPGYKARVAKQLENFREQELRAEGRLAGGTNVTAPENNSNVNNPPPEQIKPTQEQLDVFAKDAIAQGADPKAVQARIAQMRGQNGR